MNVHIGVPEFLSFAAMSVIFGFIWRLIAIKFADSNLGKAMAFIN
jgi:hypothetical protein